MTDSPTPTSQSDETAIVLDHLHRHFLSLAEICDKPSPRYAAAYRVAASDCATALVANFGWNLDLRDALKAARATSPPAPKAAAEAAVQQLHDAIMNIPADPALADEWLGGSQAYKSGHRDARHTAAELVLGSPLPVSPVAGGEEKP